MDDPADSLMITMMKDDVVLFLVIMIIWDILRAFFIAWLIPRLPHKKRKKRA